MMMAPRISHMQSAVSILTCTKRPECMNTLLDNYSRQNYRNKELIIILNNSKLKLTEYIKAAKQYKNIRIYSIPERVSLGSCLNYGIKLSKYRFIAKFDDDDYYAPNYLTESMRILLKTNADIVGKRAHFMYLGGKNLLLFRYYDRANKYVPLVQGATLLVKRKVFSQIAFPNQDRGECIKFCANCLAKGFKIYSESPYNFVAIRRRNSKNHTWIVSDKYLLTKKVKVMRARNIRKFVSRS